MPSSARRAPTGSDWRMGKEEQVEILLAMIKILACKERAKKNTGKLISALSERSLARRR